MDRNKKICIGKSSNDKWLFSIPFISRQSADESGWHGSTHETFNDAIERLNTNIRARDAWASAARIEKVAMS
jgi:hypothetical protein